MILKRNWERCPRDAKLGRWAAPCVSLNKKGEIRLSRVTHESMRSPAAYYLLFDSLNQTIGLDPVNAKMPDAYPAAPRGRHGGKVIRAFRLTQKFGIHIPETIRFVRPEKDENGILVLDLRTARMYKRPQTRAPAPRER